MNAFVSFESGFRTALFGPILNDPYVLPLVRWLGVGEMK